MACRVEHDFLLSEVQVVFRHHLDECSEAHRGLPAQDAIGLRAVAEKRVNLCRPVSPDAAIDANAKFSEASLFSGRFCLQGTYRTDGQVIGGSPKKRINLSAYILGLVVRDRQITDPGFKVVTRT